MAKIIRKDLEAKLAALNGAEWDSMSDDSMGDEVTQDDVDMVIADDDEDSNHQEKETGKPRKKKMAHNVVPIGPAGQPSGVVYIGHIPHGFYEEAMNGFFSQFGDVVRVRVSRSKKSTRCKGYAYVEFDSPEVACIVAETIDGYYLYEKQLVCRVLKFDEIHPNLFNGAGIQFKNVNWHGMYRERYNADRTPAKDKNHVKKLLARDNAKRKRLAGLGIDYDFDGFATSLKDRQVAEGPAEAVVESNSKEKGSGSKKRKSEGKAAPTDPSGERKEPPSATKTQVDEKSVTKKSKNNKVSSKKSKANTPSKSKHGEDEKSPPSTKTKSVKSGDAGAADMRKMRKQEAIDAPASGSQKGREDAGSGGPDKKNRTKTPTKEKEVASRNPPSSEGKPVKDKGSASKGSSTKRKSSKTPAHKDDGAPPTTSIPGSGAKGTKMVSKGSTSPAGDRRAKRNKPSKQ